MGNEPLDFNALTPAQKSYVNKIAKERNISTEKAIEIFNNQKLQFEGDVAIIESRVEKFNENPSTAKGLLGLGALIGGGAGIGFLCGGPAGALIGGAAGLLLGSANSCITQDVDLEFKFDAKKFAKEIVDEFKKSGLIPTAEEIANAVVIKFKAENIVPTASAIATAVANAMKNLMPKDPPSASEIATAVAKAMTDLMPKNPPSAAEIATAVADAMADLMPGNPPSATDIADALKIALGTNPTAKEIAEAIGETIGKNPTAFDIGGEVENRLKNYLMLIISTQVTPESAKEVAGILGFTEDKDPQFFQALDALSPRLAKIEADINNLKTTFKDFKILDYSTILDSIQKAIENITIEGASVDLSEVESLLNKIEGAVANIKTNAADITNTYNIIKDLNLPKLLGDGDESFMAQLKAGNAKLDDIRKLLENIDKTTTSSDTKLGLLGITVNNLYDDFSQYGPEVTDLLTKILAKIPEGCHCPDYTNVFAEIKIIIQEIKDKMGDDKDPKHEGVLDDLDDLFA